MEDHSFIVLRQARMLTEDSDFNRKGTRSVFLTRIRLQVFSKETGFFGIPEYARMMRAMVKKIRIVPEAMIDGFMRTAEAESERAETAKTDFDVPMSFRPFVNAGGNDSEATARRDFSIERSMGRARSAENAPSKDSKKNGEIRKVVMSRVSSAPGRGFLKRTEALMATRAIERMVKGR
jgi:hypothetical protein